MKCCRKCFEDPFLQRYIRENGARGGRCSFCGTNGTFTIDPAELESFFERFLDLYTIVEIGVNRFPDEDPLAVGDFLADVIQETWVVFSERLVEQEQHHSLLQKIYDGFRRSDELVDSPDVKDLWTERSFLRVTPLDKWDERAQEWKELHISETKEVNAVAHAVDVGDPEDLLGWDTHAVLEDLEHVSTVIAEGQVLYRARLGFEEDGWKVVAYRPQRMGAPPPEKATAARANPAGTSYLYCAEDEATAIAEIRPARGNYVTVATLLCRSDLRVADFRTKVYASGSPFEYPYLGSLLRSFEFFNFLGDELAKPLRRNDATLDYVPTQYLAAWIRALGLDGISYPSAMNEGGRNFVIFDPSQCEVVSSRLVEVTRTQIEFSDPEPHKVLGWQYRLREWSTCRLR